MEAHEECPAFGRHVDLDFFAFSWKLQTQLNQVQAAQPVALLRNVSDCFNGLLAGSPYRSRRRT